MSDMSNFDILTNAILSANVEVDNGYISLNFGDNTDVENFAVVRSYDR